MRHALPHLLVDEPGHQCAWDNDHDVDALQHHRADALYCNSSCRGYATKHRAAVLAFWGGVRLIRRRRPDARTERAAR